MKIKIKSLVLSQTRFDPDLSLLLGELYIKHTSTKIRETVVYYDLPSQTINSSKVNEIPHILHKYTKNNLKLTYDWSTTSLTISKKYD